MAQDRRGATSGPLSWTRRRGVVVALGLVVLAGSGAGALLALRGGGLPGNTLVIERPAESASSEEGAAEAADAAVGSGVSKTDGNEPSASVGTIVIHVDGAVAAPGVYALEGEDVRAADAVRQAGGLLPEADTSQVNLAAPLADGEKLWVPRVGEAPVASAAAVPGATTGAASSLVNINTASAEELMGLSGIGSATAAAIIEERQSGGPFASVDDLMRTTGIGEKKLEKIRDKICV